MWKGYIPKNFATCKDEIFKLMSFKNNPNPNFLSQRCHYIINHHLKSTVCAAKKLAFKIIPLQCSTKFDKKRPLQCIFSQFSPGFEKNFRISQISYP